MMLTEKYPMLFKKSVVYLVFCPHFATLTKASAAKNCVTVFKAEVCKSANCGLLKDVACDLHPQIILPK